MVAVMALAAQPALAAVDARGQSPTAANNNEAPIVFWNRTIAVVRVPLAGASPQDRADQAVKRLAELPLTTRARDIMPAQITVLNQRGVAFLYQGRSLIFLTNDDFDLASGETLDKASERVLRNLDDALAARESERRWPVVRRGLLYSLLALLLLWLANFLIWRGYHWLVRHLYAIRRFFSDRLRLFGADIVPPILKVARSLLKLFAWVLTLAAIYSWLGFSLRQFPYTEPWGNQLGAYVLQLLQQLGRSAVLALPGIVIVVLIIVVARWISSVGRAFFHQVAVGKMRLAWMDADVAQATERIFAAVVWIFAVVVAYPYIPGSSTDAFKGISVFFGLVISLGSTGIINQIMSGLFVVYSKALKTGDWVKVNDTEGEVLEVGLLAAKIRTIEGQEVTMPNSVLVGTSTTNYTHLGRHDGMIASTTVTIGYDAPWRQVHALLLLAAERTANIRKQPEPYVIQRQLSDFYPEYTLIVRLEQAKLRIETISKLLANIQDAFNEFGVQILSPHYLMQPEQSVVIPREKWHQPPAEPGPDSQDGR